MSHRQSFDVPELPHRSPIPSATRVGPLIWSSPIPPVDVATGEAPDDVAEQVDHVFANLARVLEAAGVTFDDVGKIEFWILDKADRGVLNEAWARQFPDAESRPARQIQESTVLPPGIRLMATFQAVARS